MQHGIALAMDASSPYYHELAAHYERCLEQHGATHLGVDWPNSQDLMKRFAVMLQVCGAHEHNISLLDLGCGYGALLAYIKNSAYQNKLVYTGMDLSQKMIDVALAEFTSHPEEIQTIVSKPISKDLPCFEQRDILLTPLSTESFDYIIMNGLFTEKRSLSQAQMEMFFAQMLSQAFRACREGLAFNVMNYHVDWFREDLFHLAFDRMAEIVMQHCSRHFTIRADYGLYEYTVYVYKKPRLSTS